MMRTYKYRAFAPRAGREAFALAGALKRDMWRDLCALQAALAPEFSAARKAKDQEAIAALRKRRAAAIADIRRGYAARGLAWGDYNAVAFQFDGACRASAARGALPGDHDGALGEAVVRQIMNGCRPHNLCARNDVTLQYLPPDEVARRRKPGGRRAAYRRALLDFQIRTDRNPVGAAAMAIEFVMHRPLPPDSRIVEVRILRTLRPVINIDRSAGTAERWHVCFAVKLGAPARTDTKAVGIVPDWRNAGELGSNALIIAHNTGSRTILFGEDHLAAWRRSRELFALADAETDPAAKEARLAEATIFRRRIARERTLRHRTLAAEIARSARIVGVQKSWLAGKGVKNFTAPAEFLRELRHAVEMRGGCFVEVRVKKADFSSSKKLATYVKNQAEIAFSRDEQADILQAAE